VKAWTRGWDIYHPHQLVCWHYYNFKHRVARRPLHQNDCEEWVSLNKLSEQRFRQILGIERSRENFGIYGLGSDRSLIQYVYFYLKNALSWGIVPPDIGAAKIELKYMSGIKKKLTRK
jgi:Glycosyltransferase (GlcNAc)